MYPQSADKRPSRISAPLLRLGFRVIGLVFRLKLLEVVQDRSTLTDVNCAAETYMYIIIVAEALAQAESSLRLRSGLLVSVRVRIVMTRVKVRG